MNNSIEHPPPQSDIAKIVQSPNVGVVLVESRQKLILTTVRGSLDQIFKRKYGEGIVSLEILDPYDRIADTCPDARSILGQTIRKPSKNNTHAVVVMNGKVHDIFCSSNIAEIIAAVEKLVLSQS